MIGINAMFCSAWRSSVHACLAKDGISAFSSHRTSRFKSKYTLGQLSKTAVFGASSGLEWVNASSQRFLARAQGAWYACSIEGMGHGDVNCVECSGKSLWLPVFSLGCDILMTLRLGSCEFTTREGIESMIRLQMSFWSSFGSLLKPWNVCRISSMVIVIYTASG
jgi:hypothetical protein